MGVFQNDCVKDAALNELATADLLSLCEDQPTTYADATTAKGSGGKKLGSIALTGGDFTIADGDASGRKQTLAQKTDVPLGASGDWDHIALTRSSDSTLLQVMMLPNCAVVAVDAGNKKFTIAGDRTSVLANGDRVTIRGSTGNNGGYTVSSVAANGANTDVVVSESIPSSTADGTCIYGAQAVTSGNKATTNTVKLDEIADLS